MKLRYFTEKQAESIKNYKYSGSDQSVLYKYVLGPFADIVVKLFPKTVAANTITCIAFVVSVITYIICNIVDPRADVIQPWWLNLIVALNFITYQTLDNVDGRQARRTGTSSPLGLLMDHGIDCLISSIMIFSLSCVFVTGPTWKQTLMWFVVNNTFFWTLWEQYINNEFRLPSINGPSDGIAGSFLLSFFSVIYPGFLTTQLKNSYLAPVADIFGKNIETMTIGTFILVLVFFAMIITIFSTLYIVTKKNKHLAWKEYIAMYTILIPFHIVLSSHIIWMLLSTYYDYNDIPKRYPAAFIMLHGLTFCILINKLMIYHMTKEPFPIWHWELTPLIICFLFSIVPAPAEIAHWVYEAFFWVALTVISVIYIRFAYYIVDDLAQTCNIYVFSVKPKEPKISEEKEIDKINQNEIT